MTAERTSPGSSLTVREQEVSRLGILDLATGYPRMSTPAWLADILYPRSAPELLRRYRQRFAHATVPSFHRLPAPAALEADLISSMLGLLGLPRSLAPNCFCVLSGSMALERMLSALLRPGGEARLPGPVFDVIPALIGERRARIRWWELDWAEPAWHLAGTDLDTADVTIVVSPDNPSGLTVPAATLRGLATAAADAGTVLIVDQSFALLSADGVPAPLLAASADRGDPWVMLWDTGKSFDLDGEKLAFVIVGDPLLAIARRSIPVTHGTLPCRLTMQMALALSEAADRGYPAFLAGARARNHATLKNLAHADATVSAGDFGGFALVDPPTGDMEILLRAAERQGIGLITTDSFVRTTPFAHRYRPVLRLPLLRDPDFMEAAVEGLGRLMRPAA